MTTFFYLVRKKKKKCKLFELHVKLSALVLSDHTFNDVTSHGPHTQFLIIFKLNINDLLSLYLFVPSFQLLGGENLV